MGFGLGGVMFNVIVFMFEYCLEWWCFFFIIVMFCGFILGLGFGGIVVV